MALLAMVAFCRVGLAETESEDEEVPFRPGLIGTITIEDSTIRRIDSVVSIGNGGNASDRPRHPVNFKASWRGRLKTFAGKHRLDAFSAGRVRIKLNGTVLVDQRTDGPEWMIGKEVQLTFGWHPLEIEYEATGDAAALSLYWTGPTFALMPMGAEDFYHNPQLAPPDDAQRGAFLTHALRCAACHDIEGAAQSPSSPARSSRVRPAPSLEKLAGNVHPGWLLEQLVENAGHRQGFQGAVESRSRRMPSFGLSRDEATAIATYLLQRATAKDRVGLDADADDEDSSSGNRESGEELFMTLGCLACHQYGSLGGSSLFGGGDLLRISEKRPDRFFRRWLSDPATVNRHHRMPVFDLTPQEQADLVEFLRTSGESPETNNLIGTQGDTKALVIRGHQLFTSFRCAACHVAEPDSTREAPTPTLLSTRANWEDGCTAEPDVQRNRPGYYLTQTDRVAIEQFVAKTGVSQLPGHKAALLLTENNCLACHARDGVAGIADKLPAVVAEHPHLEPLVPWMTPPALASVGDKLHETAMRDAIRRGSDGVRPWLRVRMPKFTLSDSEVDTLVQRFVARDRIPPDHPSDGQHRTAFPSGTQLEMAGRRLVTSDGFGCLSCHQIGTKQPKVLPGVVGPALNLLEQRVRRRWFDRFVRNPARIIPRMEMPSVNQPVRGVLDENLDAQLEAVWRVLNRPGFEPPDPQPIRVLRRSGVAGTEERCVFVTDVVHIAGQRLIKPLLVGFPNRHNLLFDLETNQLHTWSVGDVALQRVSGKTWFWEAAGTALLQTGLDGSDLALVRDQQKLEPVNLGQFTTEFDEIGYRETGLFFRHRLCFRTNDEPDSVLTLTQNLSLLPGVPPGRATLASSGVRRSIDITGCRQEDYVEFRLLSADQMAGATWVDGHRAVKIAGEESFVEVARSMNVPITSEGTLVVGPAASPDARIQVTVDYTTNVPADQFHPVPSADDARESVPLDVVPGFEALELPITDELLPTGLAWRADETLVVTSLKGRVWLARDTDGDEIEDTLTEFSDGLAAPFGAAASGDAVDVVNKYALLRLWDDDGDDRADRIVTLASGWGHTADYHDWAVGLPRDEQGSYYVALASASDQRSDAAARWRGGIVQLTPRQPTRQDPRPYGVEPVCNGFRFPIGIARNRHGSLFVTDNQGEYTPFNELNHALRGRWYGFIPMRERGANAPRTPIPPAVKIPHPWTRSVNGICFLDTPDLLRAKRGRDVFGPFEGHLVGCEYDTRRLIRLSLQRVGDTMQGAAYPFSYYHPREGPRLTGPVVCAVSPRGDLWVGNMRESGWGGGNNHGRIVRLRLKSLPPGIAEARATTDGFELHLIGPILADLAGDPDNYSISSYTRVPTPAYGGPDKDRRQETIRKVSWDATGSTVRIVLDELRLDFVYEIQLKSLAGEGQEFFPTEAYFTLLAIPD